MTGMSVDPGLQTRKPNLDEFVLARIAEDKRIAADAAAVSGREDWDGSEGGPGAPLAAEHVAHFDPGRVLAECAARRRLALVCREMGPDLHFLGTRPEGLADFPLTPSDQHELAALTLALLAMPYAGHHDYSEEWRP
jgi:hypothetical protein